jgi:hypothetical protein
MLIKLSVVSIDDPVLVNTSNISTIYGKIVKMNNSDIIELEEDALHELLLSLGPKEKTIKNTEPKKELLELFEKLHILTGGKGKAVFSLGREKKLGDLITKHRMTPELLIKAATNIGEDEFLQGENDSKKRYGDVDYLLRPDKAAKWSEDQEEKKKRGMF